MPHLNFSTLHFLEKTLSKQQDAPELVDVESWFLRGDMLYKYECDHIDEHNRAHPR